MHENYDNDDHNCHQQPDIDIDDLKKCVICTKHGKKEENVVAVIVYRGHHLLVEI